MPLSETMSEAAYTLIHRALRSEILSGRRSPGLKLPPERDLCAQYGVSRITVRHALRLLADEGLVERHRSRGTYVRAATPRRLPIVNRDFTGSVRAEAPGMARRLLSMSTRHEPPTHIREALKLHAAQRCLLAERLDVLHGKPVACDRAYIPRQYASSVDDRMLARIDFLEAWLAAEGITRGQVSQSIEAIEADRESADRLDMEPRRPVLFTTDVIHDAAGAPVAAFESIYRGDRFRLVSTSPL